MRENREGIIRLEHITDTVMIDVLEFMRAGSVKITPTNVLDLIEAAEYFILPSLKTIAGRYIDYRLSPSDCISLYHFLEKYQCEELVIRNVKQFIFSNIAAVTESQDFLNLESQQVERWISSDEIAVSSEDDVFKIILRWIEENKNNQKENFAELFRHVRLVFLSRDFLKMDVVTNDLVKENSECLKLARDGDLLYNR